MRFKNFSKLAKKANRKALAAWLLIVIGGGIPALTRIFDPNVTKIEALAWWNLGAVIVSVPILAYVFSQTALRAERHAGLLRRRAKRYEAGIQARALSTQERERRFRAVNR